MDFPITEIHQVGADMVHLVRDKIESSEEYLGLIEGGGVCLAQSFASSSEAETWLRNMFGRLFRSHRCDLGCIRLPGSEFLAEAETLQRLSRFTDTHSVQE
jgi:hypothetical protein